MNVIILIGNPGAGKTTFLYDLVETYKADPYKVYRNNNATPPIKVPYTAFGDKVCAIGRYNKVIPCRSKSQKYQCFETSQACMFTKVLMSTLDHLKSIGFDTVILDGHKAVFEINKISSIYDVSCVYFDVDEETARTRYESRCGLSYDAMGKNLQNKVKRILESDTKFLQKEDLIAMISDIEIKELSTLLGI